MTGLTPLWYNPSLRIPLKYQWLQKGISIIGYILDKHNEFLSLEDFQKQIGIKTNFLEYGGFILTVKLFLDDKEKSHYNLTCPTNCLINSILSKDKKGVSNLYRCLHTENNKIIANVCTKWYERSGLLSILKNSFTKTNVLVDDIYLKYIQFRTLHYRFYTNDLPLKCKITTTDLSSQCNIAKDSNTHMLLYCNVSNNLWENVESWIRNLGMENYHLTDRRKILGDLENPSIINMMILNTKKVI